MYLAKALERQRIREIEIGDYIKSHALERYVMKYPPTMLRAAMSLFAVTGYFIFLIVVLVLLKLSGTDEGSIDPRAIIVLAIIALASFIPPWVGFIRFVGLSYEVSASGITTDSPFGGKTHTSWGEVRKVTYSYLLDSYVIKTDERTLRIRAILEGIDFFLDNVKRNVPAARRTRMNRVI